MTNNSKINKPELMLVYFAGTMTLWHSRIKKCSRKFIHPVWEINDFKSIDIYMCDIWNRRQQDYRLVTSSSRLFNLTSCHLIVCCYLSCVHVFWFHTLLSLVCFQWRLEWKPCLLWMWHIKDTRSCRVSDCRVGVCLYLRTRRGSLAQPVCKEEATPRG